jgi:mono/diheme cytochrome c family protein
MRPRILLLLLFAVIRAAAADPEPAKRAHPLTWDAMEKSIDAKPEDGVATFKFTATNTSDQPVEIVGVQPSCGCTVAETPPRPWIIAPGAKSSFSATVDFRGKDGRFSKTIFVHTPVGTQDLHVTVNIPQSPETARERNRQMASVDRQAVFRGECASCHATPTVGKTGGELFQAACAICHQANPRATMVPDLMVARETRDAAYWQRWIGEGKEGTLMPGFAKRHQGPLSDAQIASLVEYALANLPTAPRAN